MSAPPSTSTSAHDAAFLAQAKCRAVWPSTDRPFTFTLGANPPPPHHRSQQGGHTRAQGLPLQGQPLQGCAGWRRRRRWREAGREEPEEAEEPEAEEAEGQCGDGGGRTRPGAAA